MRVIDALAVYEDAAGAIEVEHLSNLTKEEAVELGSKVGALIGLGIEGDEAWDVLEDIPDDSAAALVLIEHHWAVPLRGAVMRAGGFRLADGFISEPSTPTPTFGRIHPVRAMLVRRPDDSVVAMIWATLVAIWVSSRRCTADVGAQVPRNRSAAGVSG